MTRRDQIYKWCIYALGLFPIWVLDAFVLSRYPLLGITPTLLPLAVSAVAVLEGALPGSGFGLAVGLLWTLAYPGSSSLLVFGMALAGFLVGIVSQYALNQNFLGCLICSAAVLAVQEVVRLLARPCSPQIAPIQSLLQVAVPEFLWSLCWWPLVYLIFRSISAGGGHPPGVTCSALKGGVRHGEKTISPSGAGDAPPAGRHSVRAGLLPL